MPVVIRLKQIRENKGISQAKLAALIDMSIQSIQRIEQGRATSLPFNTLDKLCEALNCEIQELLVRVPSKS